MIDAVINRDEPAHVASRPKENIYQTFEPAKAFHSRIQFCISVHDAAVQAMRFPDKGDKEAELEERKRADAEERELAAQLEDDDDEDDMDQD